MSAKDYIDRNVLQNQEYYSACGNVSAEFFYALTEQALKNKANYNYTDFFFNSISQQHINAYQINLDADLSCTVSYSMPIEVQKNILFNPAIYMIEQSSTGNYPVEVSVELNRELPYLLESNMQIKNQSNTHFIAQNVSGDFYFTFSSAKKPESLYENKDDHKLTIILSVIASAMCVIIPLTVYFVLRRQKKNKNSPS